jgi:hypothetical protein
MVRQPSGQRHFCLSVQSVSRAIAVCLSVQSVSRADSIAPLRHQSSLGSQPSLDCASSDVQLPPSTQASP